MSLILDKETDRYPEIDVLPNSMMILYLRLMVVRDALRWIYWCPYMIRCDVFGDDPRSKLHPRAPFSEEYHTSKALQHPIVRHSSVLPPDQALLWDSIFPKML